MKPAIIALALLTIFAAEACSGSRGGPVRSHPPLPPPPASPPDLMAPAPPPAPPAEAAPAAPPAAPAPAPAKPAPPKAALDAVRTLVLIDGMERVSDSGLEDSLEKWAEGKEISLDHVTKRTGVYLEVAPKIKWEEHDKRSKDPADFDRLVLASIEAASELVAAARAREEARIAPLSDRLLQVCVDCHTGYK